MTGDSHNVNGTVFYFNDLMHLFRVQWYSDAVHVNMKLLSIQREGQQSDRVQATKND